MTGFLAGLAPGLYLLLLALLLGWALKRWFDPLPPRILAVFGVVLCLFYGSVLFGGRVLLPVEILTRHPPFAVLRPPKVELANRLQLDLITMVAPSLALVRREIRAGEWPLWNHLAGAGMPLLADPQAQAFQPLVVAAYPLALEVATGVTAALRVLVALVFLFLLLRRQGLSEAPALFGSLAFALGGFLQLWLGWPIANSAALLPLLLYAVAISDDRGERRDFLLLAFAVWAVLLAGQPETTVNDLLLAGAFAGARIWTRRRSRVPEEVPHGLRRLLGRWALAGAIAAGAAAPLLLPAADYLPQTHRNARIELRNRQVLAGGILQGWRTAAAVKDQLRHLELRLLPVAAPNAFGNNRFGLYWGHDFINEDAGAFAGGAALLLALLAAVPLRAPQRRFREERFFLALALVSLVVLVRPPGTMPVLAALPLLGKSATWQHRAVLPLGLAIAWLAACALERWRAQGVRWAPLAAVAGGLAAIVAWAYLGAGRPPASIPPGTLQTLRWQSLAVNLAAIVAAALLLAPWRRRGNLAGEGPARAGWRLALLAVVATAELCWFHQPANPGQPRQLYYPTTPAVAFLEHHLRGPQGFRFAALGPMLPANGAAVYDLADARYLNPLKPWNVALVTRPLLASDLDVNDVFQVLEHPLYKLLGVRYMMTPPGTRMPPPWRLELGDPSAWVYERPDPLPRLFLPGAVEVLPGDAWVAWMKVPRDYAERAVFREGPDDGAHAAPGIPRDPKVTLRDEGAHTTKVILSACGKSPGPSHYPRAERHIHSVVIPSGSEGPGGRVERSHFLPVVWEASLRPGPSLPLGMTIGASSALTGGAHPTDVLTVGERSALTAGADPRQPPTREGASPSPTLEKPLGDGLAMIAISPAHIRTRAALSGPRAMASNLYQDGGWRLLVDGRRRPTVLADGPFLGAWLPTAPAAPAGGLRLDLLYRPRAFLPGCLLAGLAGAVGLIWFVPPPFSTRQRIRLPSAPSRDISSSR